MEKTKDGFITVKIDENDTFEFYVLKETEKAVQIEVPVIMGNGGFHAGLWMPKSMLMTGWFYTKKARELEDQLADRYGKSASILLASVKGEERRCATRN
jgi:hypothetical protein